LQAGTISNPTLSAEVEDFGGNGAKEESVRAEQMTVRFEQALELGGHIE
jgi:hypothetical protein